MRRLRQNRRAGDKRSVRAAPSSAKIQNGLTWYTWESRFELKTNEGGKITLAGVKPIGQWQWQLKAFWLYGAVEPLTGESLFWQFSDVKPECYQQFLNELAAGYPNSLNLL